MQDKDNLERFIENNKSSFDLKEPKAEVWSNIETELRPKSVTLWYWKAAVILLIGAVAFLLTDKFLPQSPDVTSFDDVEVLASSNLEKFEELEFFYTSIISKKRDKVTEELETGSMFNFLDADLEELDVIYKDLKDVFLESQQSDEVLDRLIHLLRQKIHILNSQLDILERDKLPDDMKEDIDVSM
ncbi:hypothetical protein [Roseivirga sp. E12]|uniref:hypothetical protein n=1 Tax=Roseivirga sp. E12 TaxID=2819237 RepID=UPI001ABD43A2|nr:hypothetical protein [Roseivirga sp. E12]MBO3698330.1 hypothetical protein [Roseivirga sp. E12]